MAKFLIGESDAVEPLAIVEAETAAEAIKKFINHSKPDELFLDNLHNSSKNMSFSEKFHIDWDDEKIEIIEVPREIVLKRIKDYFRGKPEYAKIYIQHWDAEENSSNDEYMQDFPEDMIDWIWQKELKAGDWITLKAYDISQIKEF